MKYQHFILVLLVTQLHGQAETKKSAFRDAATNESLTEKFREASTKAKTPSKQFEPATEVDTSVTNKGGGLLANSDLITFNGSTTLVPKDAIIQLPEKYKDRINHHISGAKILTWKDFYSINRGWISTIEVDMTQAKGEKLVSPELMEIHNKKGNLVVAVLRGGPISLRPPKVETEEKAEDKAKTEVDAKTEESKLKKP